MGASRPLDVFFKGRNSMVHDDLVMTSLADHSPFQSTFQAIEILDADEAHATFSKTYSFLQQKSADDRLQRASKAGCRNFFVLKLWVETLKPCSSQSLEIL